MGCYGDGDGPYKSIPGGGKRTLPAALNTGGLTHEQCAQAAGQAGYDVFALQSSGNCFMGTFGDVSQMSARRKLDDALCSATPCVAGTTCGGLVNKVYSIGASSSSKNWRVWSAYNGELFNDVNPCLELSRSKPKCLWEPVVALT
jgi:hypothetical protein